MKSTTFGLYYLGGRVDLLRLREHLVAFYPDATIVNSRQQTILYVPVAAGEVPDASSGNPVPFEIVNYQFESGCGLALFTFRPRTQGSNPLALEPLLGAGPVAGPTIDYLKQALAVQSVGDISSLLRDEESRQKLKAQTGIQMNYVGLDDLSPGYLRSRTVLQIGTDLSDEDTNRAVDLCSDDLGLLFAFNPRQLWAPVLTEKVREDLVLLQLRELGAVFFKGIAIGWLDQVRRQLAQMRHTLAEKNQVVWAQERDDVERTDVHFHLFASDVRHFLARTETPFLEIIDQERWDQISRFARQRQTTNETLDEAHRAIERMTRPLDFREFQLLKTGVEEVEGRIMLLTVLLVLIELFTLFVRPESLPAKGVLLGLVILIPVSFLLFERWRRRDIGRRGRRLLLRTRIERSRAEIKDLESEIARSRSEDFFADETRDAYIAGLTEGLNRLKNRLAAYEAELGGK